MRLVRQRPKERCETACQPEGKYRHLEPVAPEHWEVGPELPAFREMVEMAPALRLAWLYLMAYYLDWQNRKE